MLSYITRRLLLMIPTLIGITLLVFFVMALSPGSVTTVALSAEGNMRPEERQRIERYLQERYGLGDRLLKQYGRWLNHISPIGFKDPGRGFPASWSVGFKAPDLGESLNRRRSVWSLLREAMPATLLLNAITIPIVYIIAITSGIYAARHRGKLLDVGVGTGFLALYSMPVMWIGVMLLGFFASRDYWQLFPTGNLHDITAAEMAFLPSWQEGDFHRGWLLDTLWHLALPVICLTYGSFAFLSKLMRASMLENLTADFARTARAKGLSENIVLFRHVLSNSVLPLITVAASIIPGLLGGALIVESIFSIEGMGRLMLEAIRMKDQELVLSETCVVALIGLLSLLIADICYAIADPRVSYE
jgi:peptide/nickel transport system permease protein